MTPHDTFDTSMNMLADALGLDLPERAEGAPVVLSIDGTEVTIRENADGRTVLLAAEIGEMPPDAQGAFASVALQSNYTAMGGTALSLDDETGELFATASLPLALADQNSLSHAIEALVDTAEEWRRLATVFLDVDEEAALSKADDEEASPLSGIPDFIRV